MDQEKAQEHYRTSVYVYFWIKKRPAVEKLQGTAMNSEEHEGNLETLSADLRSEKKRTYSHRSSAEVATVL